MAQNMRQFFSIFERNDEFNFTFEKVAQGKNPLYVCTTENFEKNSNSGQGLGDGKANKDWRYKSHLSAKP